VPWISIIVSVVVIIVSVYLPPSYIFFNFPRVGSIKRVSLRSQIIKAAAERPDIYLLAQVVLLAVLKNLRRGVVEVATETLVFEQLLKVVRHSN